MHTVLCLCTIFIVQDVAAYCDDDDDYCVRYIAPLYQMLVVVQHTRCK